MLNNHYLKYDINILNEILQNVFRCYILVSQIHPLLNEIL